MRSIFLDEASALQAADFEGSASEKIMGQACDALIAYVGQLDSASNKLLFFVLELIETDTERLIAYQRLLAASLAQLMGEGFSHTGAHISFCGERITFADFGRGKNYVNARLGFYLPHNDSGLSTSQLTLTPVRLPQSIDAWAPVALDCFIQQYNDIQAAAFAIRAAPNRMRE